MTGDPGQRPEEFSSFVGRDREVADLRDVLRVVRAVTLCGAGGIGKTRLALRLLDEVGGQFPDGAWIVELAELRQSEHVVAKVAAALRVTEEQGRPLLDTLADSLRQRRAVLVLDNCEHLIDACAALCQRLLTSSPGLQIIATSREPLRVAAEAVWQVPPLSLPPSDATGVDQLADCDAVRLFTERAAAVCPGFALSSGTAATVASICRALDGLPLAIELAAAWTRVLSVDQIAARLDPPLALLTSSDRTAPARQQTLRATFDWSYGLLSAAEQLLLRRLSVFAGWPLSMAEEVCADDLLPAAEVLDLMTALADKSLIELEPDALGEARYRMLQTIREYAAELLAGTGEADVMRRRRRQNSVRETEKMLAIGMALVSAPWSARVMVFRRFDVEAANVAEVLGECLADGDVESGLRICVATLPAWIVRGAFAECASWLDGFLGLAAAGSVPPGTLGAGLVGRAQLAMATGSPQAADLAMAGLELCRAAGDQFHAATAVNLMTEIAIHADRLGEAAQRAREALSDAQAAGDRWNEGYALGTMSAIAGIRGNLREAERLAEQALTVMREIEQQWGAARTLLGLGDLARLRAEPDQARDYYLEALVILREIDARPEIARCLAGLGRIAIDLSDLTAARHHLTESLQLSYVAGSRIGMARGLAAIARLAVLEGDPDVAVQLAGAVSALREQSQLPPVPGARTQRLLDAAAGLGEHAIAKLWADGASMTPAEAVRLALGEPAPSRPAGTGWVGVGRVGPADALTPREREVVALLAAGLSNRDIASQLVISPATAARHVANILAKLSFSSRSQVAAWASPDGRADQLAPNSALTDSPS